MPPLEGGEHLIEILFDIGPVASTGFGAVAVSEQELSAWQWNRQIRLTPWECETIRKLSKEYASMLQDASDPSCQAPYISDAEVDMAARKALEDRFFAQLKQMAGGSPKRRGKKK